MRDPKRIIRITSSLAAYWTKHPDLRLGQLIENIFGCKRNLSYCIYNFEDDVVERRFKDLLEMEK